MRLILATITSILIANTALAETPEVCQEHFERASFTNEHLRPGESEVVALLSDLSSAIWPPQDVREERDLALDLYLQLYPHEVDAARAARKSYEATVADFADGEIERDVADQFVSDYYPAPDPTEVRQNVARLAEHLGPDHEITSRIVNVNECFAATLELMHEDYRKLVRELQQYFLAQQREATE